MDFLLWAGGDLNRTDSVSRLDSPMANAQSGFKFPTKAISWLSPTSQNILLRKAHYFMGGGRLELPCLAALPPKGSVSAISPPARVLHIVPDYPFFVQVRINAGGIFLGSKLISTLGKVFLMCPMLARKY